VQCGTEILEKAHDQIFPICFSFGLRKTGDTGGPAVLFCLLGGYKLDVAHTSDPLNRHGAIIFFKTHFIAFNTLVLILKVPIVVGPKKWFWNQNGENLSIVKLDNFSSCI
jgi:hypothetical protein